MDRSDLADERLGVVYDGLDRANYGVVDAVRGAGYYGQLDGYEEGLASAKDVQSRNVPLRAITVSRSLEPGLTLLIMAGMSSPSFLSTSSAA